MPASARLPLLRQVLRTLLAPRARAVLALGAAVLLLHALALTLLPRTPGRGWHDMPVVAAQVRRVTVVAAATPKTPVQAVAAPPATVNSRRPDTQGSTKRTGVETASDAAPQGAGAGPTALDIQAATPAASPDSGGISVPVYATQLPPPLRLLYAMRRAGQRSSVELLWRPAGDSYLLQLQAAPATTASAPTSAPAPAAAPAPAPATATATATAPAPAPAPAPATATRHAGLAWASEGRLDADGIAPTRYTESRRGRAERAVNFQRDSGRITFSGPVQAYPLVPGAQDRLSWMLQLAGVLAANPALAQPGRQVLLFVAGTRGDAEVWTFDVLGREAVEAATGDVLQALHLQRLPHRPYDTVVDVWLDPARHHLPVRTRLQLRPGGNDAGGTEFTLQDLRMQ